MTSTTKNTIPEAGASFLSDLQTFLREEDPDRFRDMFTGFIASGGTHATGAGLVHSPASLTAYPGGHYITETGAITYPDSTTHIWVICHKDTMTAVTDWTRVSGTHYLFRNTGSATRPALPVVESAILMKVTTSGGAVTVVDDRRILTPESKGFLSVKDSSFGATGDGLADDTSAIQAAIDSVSPAGDTIFLPAGTYLISSALVINQSNVFIRGSGVGNTIITTNSTTADIWTLGDGITDREDISIVDLTLTSSVTKVAGAGVDFNRVRRSRINNVRLTNMFQGIRIRGASVVLYLDDLTINDTIATTGISILIQGGNDHYLNNIVMDNVSQPLAGIQIEATGATWITNVDLIRCGTGLRIIPGAGDIVDFLFVMNSAFDTNSAYGIRFGANTSTSIIKGVSIIGCWTSSNTLDGILTDGVSGGILDGIYILNHRSFLNVEHGISLTFGKNLELDGCLLSGNSASPSGSGSFHGIIVAANIDEFSIRGCRSGQQANFLNTQGRGLIINSGTSDNYQVIANDFRTNVTEGLNDGGSGTNKLIYGNLPFEDFDNFVLGNGAAITRHLSATATLNFGVILTQTSADLTITVTGAVDGDTVALAVPAGAAPINVAFTAHVSSANTVTVRAHNYSTISQNPASGTFRVDVWKH